MKSKVFLIKKYDDLLGERLKWNTDKVEWLLQTARMDRDELAAILLMTPLAFANMMKRNQFPGPVKRLLYQISIQVGFYSPFPTPTKDKQ